MCSQELRSNRKLKRRRIFYFLFSLCTTVLIFAYLFQSVKPSEIIQVLKDVEYRYLIAFVILSLSGSLFRALRYRLTLSPAGYHPPLVALFLITLVRNVFSDLLPARIGSAIYIYLVHSRLQIPLQLASSSFALSFLFDIAALGPLLVLLLLSSSTELPFSRNTLLASSLFLFLLTAILLMALPKMLSLARKTLKYTPLLTERIRSKLMSLCEQIGSEITLAQKAGIYIPLFTLSLFVRICKYGSLYLFLLGIIIPLNLPLSKASPLVSCIGILSAEIAQSLPISGIAGFGVYEGAWALAFSLLGFPADVAKLTAISHHLFTQVYGYGLGALALIILLTPWLKKETLPMTLNTRPSIKMLSHCLLFLCAMGLCLLSLQLPSLAQSKTIVEKTISSESKEEIKQFLQDINGSILFDSSRSGSFGIYLLDPKSLQVKPLIDGPLHEEFPDPSPDGSTIVYAVSRSISRNASSEIWLADSDGKNARKIIDSGTFPTFSADGQKIFYEVDRQKVFAYSFKDNSSKEIFPKNRSNFRGRSIVKPRISPKETHIAFTSDNPDSWFAWFAPLSRGKPTMIHRGCEPAWFPNNEKLAWVKRAGAKANAGIMSYSLSSQEVEPEGTSQTEQTESTIAVLIDEDAPMGHEYFPTVSRDGKYLLYAACPHDQHDHYSAEYALYIMEIQSGKRQQLTFNNATNRWPKLLIPQNATH